MDKVTISIEDHVAEVTLNRPDKFNALDPDMFRLIAEAGEKLKPEKDVRAVVLTGAGDNFCSGLDLMSMQGDLSSNDHFREKALNLEGGEIANPFQKPSYVWNELNVPVIAALKGVAFGGGSQIALGTDIRIAAPDLRISIMEMKWGLIPDMGISQSLPRLVRMDVAKDLIFTGRVVEAEEALSLGLVTRIEADPLTAARDMARTIANKNPDAVRRAKVLLEEAWNADPVDGLRMEAELQADIIGLPNQMEAVMANMQKRAPKFA